MSRTLGIVAPKRIHGELNEPDASERQHPDPLMVDTPDGPAEVIEMFTLDDLKNIMMYVKEIHEILKYDMSYEYVNYNNYVLLLESLGVRIEHLDDIDDLIDLFSGLRHQVTAFYYVKQDDVYKWLDNERDIKFPPKITLIDKPLDLRNGYIPIIKSKTLYKDRLDEIKYIHDKYRNRGGRKKKTKRKTIYF